MKCLNIGTAGWLLLFATHGSVQAAVEDASRSVCSHAEAPVPRVVRVVYENVETPVPCKVLYEKDGGIEELGSANNSAGFCEKIERKVVRNLVAGGYQCEHAFLGELARTDRAVQLALFPSSSGTLDGGAEGATGEKSASELAIVSTILRSESDAHRYAAEFRRAYPNVATRISPVVDIDDGWRVVMGVDTERAVLDTAMQRLDPAVEQYFEIVELADATAHPPSLDYVPDDWVRYVVAACYADGKRTVGELGKCSGFVIDADAFVSCVGGGTCLPEHFADTIGDEGVDVLATLSADDPVSEARTRIVNRIEGCERVDDASEGDFAECAALALMDDDQKILYDCYQRDSSELALLKCAGSDDTAEFAMLYERCSIDTYTAAECALESVENDYVSSAAFCVQREVTEDILACALDANIDADQARIVACLDASADVAGQAGCIAQEHLDEAQATLLECASFANGLADYGLCVGERNGSLTRQEMLTAECLLAERGDADELLDCAGGHFANTEIGSCLEYGLDDARCFDPETELTRVANDRVEELLAVNDLEGGIIEFRRDLYALEGGDLSVLLARSGQPDVLEDLDAGVDAVGEKAKRGIGGFFDKLGIGK